MRLVETIQNGLTPDQVSLMIVADSVICLVHRIQGLCQDNGGILVKEEAPEVEPAQHPVTLGLADQIEQAFIAAVNEVFERSP